MPNIEVKTFIGEDLLAHLDTVADLRIRVFRDWPYLYDGNRKYEQDYLATYARSPHSVLVLAFDGARAIGAATAMPLAEEVYALQQPFRSRNIPIEQVFYFGESLLLADYRGMGIGHRLFDERERHVRRLGRYSMIAFCTVERDQSDPRRPPGQHSNDRFWARRGYQRQNDLFAEREWPTVGSDEPVRNRLRFWLRSFDPQ